MSTLKPFSQLTSGDVTTALTFTPAAAGDVPTTPAEVGAEPDLGNPDVDGKVLSSTAAGVRSWVANGDPVTNSSVNAAIADDPASTRAAAEAMYDGIELYDDFSRYANGTKIDLGLSNDNPLIGANPYLLSWDVVEPTIEGGGFGNTGWDNWYLSNKVKANGGKFSFGFEFMSDGGTGDITIALNNRPVVSNAGAVELDGIAHMQLTTEQVSAMWWWQFPATSNGTTNIITSADHQLLDGDVIGINQTTAVPSGLVNGNTYYVVNATTDTFQLSGTPGGAAIDIGTTTAGQWTWSVNDWTCLNRSGTGQWQFSTLADQALLGGCRCAMLIEVDGDTMTVTHSKLGSVVMRSAWLARKFAAADEEAHFFIESACNATATQVRIEALANGISTIATAETMTNAAWDWSTTRLGTSAAKMRGVLTFSGNAVAGETVTIGSKVYTWRASVSTTADEVKVGATILDSITNLCDAINGGRGSGSRYGSSTVANTQVFASAPTTRLYRVWGNAPKIDAQIDGNMDQFYANLHSSAANAREAIRGTLMLNRPQRVGGEIVAGAKIAVGASGTKQVNGNIVATGGNIYAEGRYIGLLGTLTDGNSGTLGCAAMAVNAGITTALSSASTAGTYLSLHDFRTAIIEPGDRVIYEYLGTLAADAGVKALKLRYATQYSGYDITEINLAGLTGNFSIRTVRKQQSAALAVYHTLCHVNGALVGQYRGTANNSVPYAQEALVLQVKQDTASCVVLEDARALFERTVILSDT